MKRSLCCTFHDEVMAMRECEISSATSKLKYSGLSLSILSLSALQIVLHPGVVSPVQPALLAGSPRIDGFHVLIIGLPQGTSCLLYTSDAADE